MIIGLILATAIASPAPCQPLSWWVTQADQGKPVEVTPGHVSVTAKGRLLYGVKAQGQQCYRPLTQEPAPQLRAGVVLQATPCPKGDDRRSIINAGSGSVLSNNDFGPPGSFVYRVNKGPSTIDGQKLGPGCYVEAPSVGYKAPTEAQYNAGVRNAFGLPGRR